MFFKEQAWLVVHLSGTGTVAASYDFDFEQSEGDPRKYNQDLQRVVPPLQ
ncbi:hypothetical protein [Candidatus Bartonella washoeensis]|nr:hypothetical protein [Bartonella washoeensis]